MRLSKRGSAGRISTDIKWSLGLKDVSEIDGGFGHLGDIVHVIQVLVPSPEGKLVILGLRLDIRIGRSGEGIGLGLENIHWIHDVQGIGDD